MDFQRLMEDTIPNALAIVSIATALVVSLSALYGAFRSGLIKNIRVGSFEIEGVDQATLERIRAEISSVRGEAQIPFEIEQLASYCSTTLGQSKISFWFSLVFASIGFLVIVGAAFIYRENDNTGTAIKIFAGLIIDAVAALFFVQSRRAQEAMGVFFEKLRTDRQFIEARRMCEEISSPAIKDKLKTILILHYSGLESKPMIDVLASGKMDDKPAPKGPGKTVASA